MQNEQEWTMPEKEDSQGKAGWAKAQSASRNKRLHTINGNPRTMKFTHVIEDPNCPQEVVINNPRQYVEFIHNPSETHAGKRPPQTIEHYNSPSSVPQIKVRSHNINGAKN